MYRFEDKAYGYKLYFEGFLTPEELEKWIEDSRTKIVKKFFGVMIDLSKVKVMSKEAGALMQKGQAMYKGMGMTRSSVLVESALAKIQFKRIAEESGIKTTERYFTVDEEQAAENWIIRMIDPDKPV